MNTIETIGSYGILPVIELDTEDQAIPLGCALLEGGLPLAEITFRTDAAENSIRRLVKDLPLMVVGAGSVLNIRQAQAAADAGARYIVSPGFDPGVVDWCREQDIPTFPGVATPTEITMALSRGLKVLKFFPAEALGGLKTLKAIAAPFPGVKYIPTGGITDKNLGEYLKLAAVHACGGSWLVARKLISDGNFAEITHLTREAISLVHSVRGTQ
jgi:2-dehydro-3-deoxyphosphogluconate aldolase/(4S)-4-hydroxy-2-oxoglutarate aldolase